MTLIVCTTCLVLGSFIALWPRSTTTRLRSNAPVPRRKRASHSLLDRIFHRKADSELELAAALGQTAAVLRTGVTTPAAWAVIADAYRTSTTPGGRNVFAIAQHARLGYPLADSPTCKKLKAAGFALIAAETVSQRTGAALGPLLLTIARSIRAEVDADAERKSAYAGPRATMRVLAGLPFGAIGLGYLMGADPLSILVGSPLGHLTLLVGLGLACAGWLVPRRMIHRAELKAGLR